MCVPGINALKDRDILACFKINAVNAKVIAAIIDLFAVSRPPFVGGVVVHCGVHFATSVCGERPKPLIKTVFVIGDAMMSTVGKRAPSVVGAEGKAVVFRVDLSVVHINAKRRAAPFGKFACFNIDCALNTAEVASVYIKEETGFIGASCEMGGKLVYVPRDIHGAELHGGRILFRLALVDTLFVGEVNVACVGVDEGRGALSKHVVAYYHLVGEKVNVAHITAHGVVDGCGHGVKPKVSAVTRHRIIHEVEALLILCELCGEHVVRHACFGVDYSFKML